MKKRVLPLLLAALLCLTGCGSFLQREWYEVKDHSPNSYESNGRDALQADTYQDLTALSRRRRAQYIAYVPQDIRFGELTVFDSVLLGRLSRFGLQAGPADRAAAARVLADMGLAPLAARSVAELSGGELQKVAIARALAQEPQLLVLDEPTGNLDVSNEHLLMREAKKAAQERHISVLSSLHDLNQALAFGDRFFFLKDGVIRYAVTRDAVTEDMLCDVFGAALRLREVDGTRVVLHGPAG